MNNIAGVEFTELSELKKSIKTTMEEIISFDKTYNIGLPIHRYRSSFDPNLPDNVIIHGHKPLLDNEYFLSALEFIRESIKKFITKKIISKISSLTLTDELLRGSSNSVATKLTVTYFLVESWRIGEVFPYDQFHFCVDMENLNISFKDVVGCVADEYNEKYMRYRLWDKKSVDKLCRYLFVGNKEYDFFELGALDDFIDFEAVHRLSINEFIAIVNETIIELPLFDCTEVNFPEPESNIYNFSEYVPVEKMDDEFKKELYDIYLDSFNTLKIQ